MKSWRLLVALLVVVALFASCAPPVQPPAAPAQPPAATSETAPAAGGETVAVGLVMKSLANEFFKVMGEGTEAWAKTRPDIALTMVGMNSETDIDTQISAVENFVTQKEDLIVLAPANSVGLVPSVKKALDAGITVVNFNVKLDDKALAEAGLTDFLFVGPDNAEGAKLAGDALGKALGEGGKVIIIEGNPGADNATQRKNGFMQSVEEYKLDLLDSVTAHWETEEANTVMTNLLTKYPDVQGVMAANNSMALGIVKALDAAGKSGTIQVVGFDNIPAVQPLLQDGKMLATIDQFGPEMAKNAIEIGLRVLGGEKLSGWIKTPVKLVTAADLAGAAAPAAGGEPVAVGLVMKSLANEFFKVMGEGTEAWAKTRPDIALTMVGMNSETDIDTQISAVENFVTQKQNLIVLAPAELGGVGAVGEEGARRRHHGGELQRQAG